MRFKIYNHYQFDIPNEECDIALDNVQMKFTDIMMNRVEGKHYDTFGLIRLGTEFGRALMLYVDGLDEAEKAAHDNRPDPYDAMRDAQDMIDEVQVRR